MAEPNFSKDFKNVVNVSNMNQEDSGNSFEEKKDVRYVIAIFILIITIIGTGLVFGLNKYLDGEVLKSEELANSQRAFLKIKEINELAAFDKQVRNLKNLGDAKEGFSEIINEFSSIVVRNVRYKNLDLSVANGGYYSVLINAEAQDLYSYIRQVEVLRSLDGPLSNVRLGNFNIIRSEGESTVNFSLSIDVPFDEINKKEV